MESNTNEPVNEETVTEAPAATKTKQGGGTLIRLNGGNTVVDMGSVGMYKEWPAFGIGDNIKVHYKIKEGDKERVQVYEGTVISIRGEGMGKSINVRRISHEVGVERIFPYHSPSIAKIEVTRRGKVRRSKLFFLRHKSGKAGRIKESFEGQIQLNAEKKKKKTTTKKKKADEAQAAGKEG